MSFAPTPPPNKTGLALLLEMLTYKRPAGSITEQLFIDRFIVPTGATPDDFGNYWLEVGDSNVLFSSHTDTVHHSDGFQTVMIGDGIISVEAKRVPRPRTEKEKAVALKKFEETGVMPASPTELTTNCLGADCTTGVWLMIEMIRAGVPGRYVFHREEEIGGNGSQWVARNSYMLAGIDYAIALDRKGYRSVITEQMTGPCCSQDFVDSLAAIMPIMEWEADATGTFTDTAHYIDFIPECTNLSVGYFNQHGPTETQDADFAVLLLDQLIQADWSKLKVGERHRSPAPWDDWSPSKTSMVDFIWEHPDEIADLLLDEGWSIDNLRKWIGK